MLSTAVIIVLLSTQNGYAQVTFTDVARDFWAKEEIEFLNGQDVISGFPDGEFRPSESITRTQAAAMLVRALNLNTENRPDPGFHDISAKFHAYDVVATVADEGLMSGSGGNFRPGETLSRGQMAVILKRAFDLSGEWDRQFRDIKSDHWAYSAIQALAANRITTGYATDTTFRASLPTTRAQFSVFLARQLEETFKPDEFPISEAERAVLALHEHAVAGKLPHINTHLNASFADVVQSLGSPYTYGLTYVQYFEEGYFIGLNPSGNVNYIWVYDQGYLTLTDLINALGQPDRQDIELGQIHTIYRVGEYELGFTRNHVRNDQYSEQVSEVFLRYHDVDKQFYAIDRSSWQTYENAKFGYRVNFPSHWSSSSESADGIWLHEEFNTYVTVFAREEEQALPDYYEPITLNNGKRAYFFETEQYGSVSYHMVLVEDGVTYHFSAEMPPYFYEENQHILDEIMLNFELRG